MKTDVKGVPTPAGSCVDNRYRLHRRLAVGGMAEVFEALDTERNAAVVLKLLLPHLCNDAEFLQMFEDEARLTTRLSHPNLVQTFAAGESDQRPFFVMELIDGCTLAQLITRTGPPPLSTTFAVIDRVLAALSYLHHCTDDAGHSLHVVHRDVNPRNVLISRDGAVKLGDLGIARSRLRAGRTRSGVIKGTIQYMAPEQITCSDIDQRADVYGAGLVLFELLTGRPYVEAEREVDLLRLAEDPPWRPPSELAHTIPQQIDALIRPALMRFPEQRYQHVDAFASALQSTARALAIEPTSPAQLGQCVAELMGPSEVAGPGLPDEGARSATQPPIRQAGATTFRRWASATAIAGALVAAAGGTAAFFWGGARPANRNQAVAPLLPSTTPTPKPSPPIASATPTVPATTTSEPSTAEDARPPVVRRHKKPRRSRRFRRTAARKPPLMPRPSPTTSATPTLVSAPPTVEPVPPGPTVQQLRLRYRAVQRAMAGKDLLVEDLPATARHHLIGAQRALETGRTDQAKRALDAIDTQIAAMQIDRAFVRRKLKRADRALQRVPDTRRDLALLRQRSSAALQSFMDGHFVDANRQLNALLHLLR